jgi:Uma2 family endonuclease
MNPDVKQAASRNEAQKSGRRKFKVGTTGWTADDLDDPRLERYWDNGRFEIVEGVLTQMPAAFFDGSLPLAKLRRAVERHLDLAGLPGDFTHEVDFIVGRRRVARPDMIFTTPQDVRRQLEKRAQLGSTRPKIRFGRFLVPPTLVVESLSIGHENHDKDLKRRWYSEFEVPNYWLLDPYTRSLECLMLKGNGYGVDVSGQANDEIKPTLFKGLVIRLGEIWSD